KADDIEWNQRKSIAFFRGSRTNAVRDRLILLARRSPSQLDARYTKNQAWRSVKDTLGEEPAKEVPFEEHCNYKYLLNLAGVAASFRLRHLLLCGSVVLNVGHEWIEFFYDRIIVKNRGRSFVESHLRVDDVLCYWRLLLKNYSKLITYRIQRVSSFKRIL
ncbi:unnamed protein product, partial [Anisakis simplex]|uniref:CAP10 domain-containing protein n=1 Tax=Anisakis simplex TaxID=6269 RepID=A0A0M3K5K2_ANISI